MPQPISLDLAYISNLVSENEIQALAPQVEKALKSLLEGTGRGSDFLGWIELPFTAEKLLPSIKKAVKPFKSCESVLSIGIAAPHPHIPPPPYPLPAPTTHPY